MNGFKIGVGVFIFVVCSTIILMFGFSGGDVILFAFIFMIVGGLLIVDGVQKISKDNKTFDLGERCYARTLGIANTGNFVLGKAEHKIAAYVYIPSQKKGCIVEESIDFSDSYDYPIHSYLSVLYYDNDINIERIVDESEIPSDVLKILSDESIIKKYAESTKKEEKHVEEKLTKEEQKRLSEKMSRTGNIIVAYIFSFVVVCVTGYLWETFRLMIGFINNLPMSILFPVVLFLNFYSIIPMQKQDQKDSKKSIIFTLLYIASIILILLLTWFFIINK